MNKPYSPAYLDKLRRQLADYGNASRRIDSGMKHGSDDAVLAATTAEVQRHFQGLYDQAALLLASRERQDAV